MSGGSLNYLYLKDSSELMNAVADLEAVEAELLSTFGAKDVARDVRRLIEYINSANNRISVLAQQLSEVLHAVEWYDSGDYGKESVNRRLDEYRGEVKAVPKLRSCPFCGKQPYIQKNYTGQNKAIYAVKCTCGVLTRFQNRQLKAVDIWNRREGSAEQTGSWIGQGDGYADGELVYDVWNCSECDYCIDDGTDDPALLPTYCPNCGAKMTASPGSSS